MKKIDFGFTPSEYQQKIFDFVLHGTGNAVINAKAGSAKTTTLVAAMKLVPKKQKCLFIAFNKSIVESLEKKLVGYDNCEVRTVHSLGFSIVCRHLGFTPIVDEYKYRNYLKNNICELSQLDCEKVSRRTLEEYVENITTLIHFGRCNLKQTPKEIAEVAKKYDIPYMHDECEVVIKCLEWGKTHLDSIDYMDMVWLPYELKMKPNGHQYDWIFNDEVQDYSHAYVDLMIRCFKRGTRFVSVGDEKQMINGFAGSSSDAYKWMRNYPKTTEFSLPICYRCDRKIIELAKVFVPDIKVRNDAGEGEIYYDCSLSDLECGDMVLCRYKAPLVKAYVKLLKKGVKCYIKGQDLGINLIDMLNGTDCENLGRELLTDGVFIRLYERLINERNDLMTRHELDLWDATLSNYIMYLYDSINTLAILADGCQNKAELITKIEKIFMEDGEGICLSTIHRAKGLESDRAFILCRSCMPPKREKREWEMEEENNLIYVAYTRAKHVLGFVSEKEVPPSGALMADDKIVDDIVFCERRVCSVLGKEMSPTNESPNFARFRLKAATKIEDLHENDNVVVMGTKKETSVEEVSLDDLLSEF